MGALHQRCPVDEHRVLYDPRAPTIDREIDKSWLRGVCRNSRFLFGFSVSSLVIDCHHEQSHVNWNVSHTYCTIFLWFHVWLTFQPCIRRYDWFVTCLCRIFWQWVYQRVYQPIRGYWHHISTSEMTRNESVRPKILADGLNRWTDGLIGRVWPTVRLTDTWTEIPHNRFTI